MTKVDQKSLCAIETEPQQLFTHASV